MLLQIHDELVFEAPAAEIARLAELVNRVMTSALELKVPLKVDIAAGPNWLDVDEIAPESAAACHNNGEWSSESLHDGRGRRRRDSFFERSRGAPLQREIGLLMILERSTPVYAQIVLPFIMTVLLSHGPSDAL